MLGNHRTAISHTCDTEALEDALEGACGGNLQVTHRLELRRLANTAIRQLIERVQLVPENGELKIELYGELAALLKLGTEPKNEHPQAESEGVQITMVAGAGFAQDPTIKMWV